MATNRQIAVVFEQVATLLAARSSTLPAIGAYRRAARLIGNWPAEVAKLADPGQLPGVGPGLAAAVRELAETGRLGLLERLREQSLPRARPASGAGRPRKRPAVVVVTEKHGPLRGRRVVRGREDEVLECDHGEDLYRRVFGEEAGAPS